jgi:hypothetical protein
VQLVERLINDPKVMDSNPAPGKNGERMWRTVIGSAKMRTRGLKCLSPSNALAYFAQEKIKPYRRAEFIFVRPSIPPKGLSCPFERQIEFLASFHVFK